MQIDNNFVMTEDAGALALSAGMEGFNFQTDPQIPTLVPGDKVIFGDAESSPMFVVVSRLFIWKSPQHLVVQFLLDSAEKPQEKP